MRLGDFIKEQRTDMGMSVKMLADAAGLKEFTIYDIERGKTKRVGMDQLTALCDALGLDAQDVAEEYPETVSAEHVHKGPAKKSAGAETPKPKPKKAEPNKDAGDMAQARKEAADMVLEMLNVFCCQLNTEGRQLSMHAMKMFAQNEFFKKEDENDEQ